MKFKSIANPGQGPGVVVKGKKMVVPNQALSLREILDRFTRNEQLPIGKDGNYHESEDDLEKVAHSDLVDRDEFIERQKETQARYDKQERERIAARRKKFEDEEREKARLKVEAELKPPAGPAK